MIHLVWKFVAVPARVRELLEWDCTVLVKHGLSLKEPPFLHNDHQLRNSLLPLYSS